MNNKLGPVLGSDNKALYDSITMILQRRAHIIIILLSEIIKKVNTAILLSKIIQI